MRAFFQDLRFAQRQLRKSRGFTVVAVLTLALGIGANAAIATAVYALLLRWLPFRDASRLLLVKETHPQAGIISASYLDFQDWRAQAKSFSSLAAYSDVHNGYAQVTANGEVRSLRAAYASADLFPTLGIAPALGRSFTAAEDSDSGLHVAILSHRVWRDQFGSDPSIVGKSVQINGQSFVVIGVMAAGRQYPMETDLWLPFAQLDQAERNGRQYHAVDAIGRLAPGVSREDAATELNTIAARLAQSYPATNRSIGVRVTTFRDTLVGQLRPTLLALFASVALVLLIACANIANLLLVRTTNRQREIAVRTALGATRGRLLRQFLAESLLLSLAGTVLGVLLALAAMPLLRYALSHIAGDVSVLAQGISISFPVLLFSAALAMVTATVFSAFPLLAAPPSLNQALRDSQPTVTGRNALRSLLAGGEIALAVVVLFAAMLLLRSFQKLKAVNPGFAVDHLVATKIDLPANVYASPQQVENFSTRLQADVERLPGVTSAAIANALPLTPSKSLTRFAVEGAPPPAPGNFPVTQLRFVSPSYFRTLKVGLRSGRMFELKDVDDPTGVFIVNQAFARRYLSGRDAVGSRLMMDVMTSHPTAVPVIGVVADAKDLGVDAQTEPVIYTAGYPNGQILLVRTSGDADALAPALRRVVAALDPNLGLSDVHSMDQVLGDSLARPRLAAWLLGLFAALSIGLAVLGVYGVLAYTAAQRTREVGVRMALGARRGQVMALFLKQAAVLAACGTVVGLVGALAMGRLLAAMLFETPPTDLLSAAATLGLLLIAGLAAGWLPALRASRIDPMLALRSE